MLELLFPFLILFLVATSLTGRLKQGTDIIKTSAEAAKRAKAEGKDVQQAVKEAQLLLIREKKMLENQPHPIVGMVMAVGASLVLSYIAWQWMTEIPPPPQVSPETAETWRWLTVILPPLLIFLVRLRRFSLVQTASSGGLQTQKPSAGLGMLERWISTVMLFSIVASAGLWVVLSGFLR